MSNYPRIKILVAAATVMVTLTACQPVDTSTSGDGVDTSKPLVASAATASAELTKLYVAAGASINGYVRDDNEDLGLAGRRM